MLKSDATFLVVSDCWASVCAELQIAFTRADVVYTDHVIVLHLQRFKIDRLHDEQLGPP